ncbi:MAG: GNAT family N-acetyltransferase [Nocardioides sp.]|nr:GNAT family N-acetyltransferase [Nocardioides sp.]
MSWRHAGADDALALMELERDANLVALSDIFTEPFPEDDVLARWALVLADQGVRVDVVDDADRLRAVAAYDGVSLRHLFVHPASWGEGLGRQGIERAVEAGGAGIRLWVLEANGRARWLYEHLGWRLTGQRQESVWAPHPVELEYRHCATFANLEIEYG